MPGRSRKRVKESSEQKGRRSSPSDDAPMSSGEAMVAPVGEVTGWIAGRAGPGIFEGFLRQAGRHEAQPYRRREVEVHGMLAGRESLAREEGGHLRPDFVAAAANARAQVRAHLGGGDATRLAECSQGGLRDSRHDTAPASVGDSHGTIADEQERQAVSTSDRQGDAGRPGDGRVACRLEARPLDVHDARSVDLTQRDELVDLEAQSREQAATILLDGFGAIGGGAAEIEGIVRSLAHEIGRAHV